MKRVMEFYNRHGWKLAICGIILILLSWTVSQFISESIGNVMVLIAFVNAVLIFIFACIDIWRTWRGKL